MVFGLLWTAIVVVVVIIIIVVLLKLVFAIIAIGPMAIEHQDIQQYILVLPSRNAKIGVLQADGIPK
jgi:hypothetical protein